MFGSLALFGRIAIALLALSGSAFAQDAWRVQKASGEVWIAAAGAQQVALTPAATIKPGDRIRTGRNGRVLLTRNSESILISPNTMIGVPTEASEGLTTTILQESGSILLEVEKKVQKHFEVETPYLVAVVKGTQFQVTVDRRGSRVDVMSGAVEVSDLKSGQNALVMPGQIAKVLSQGPGGLSLSGAGNLDPIKHGTPRAPRLTPAPAVLQRDANRASQPVTIKAALGEVKLDFNKVTKGLARSEDSARSASARNRDANANTRQGNGAVGTVAAVLGVGGNNSGNGNGSGGVGNAVGNTVGSVSNGLGNTVGGVSNALGNTVGGVSNSLGNTVGGVGNALGNTVGGVSNGLGNTVGGVGSALGNTVGNVGNGLGGLLGKLGKK